MISCICAGTIELTVILTSSFTAWLMSIIVSFVHKKFK